MPDHTPGPWYFDEDRQQLCNASKIIITLCDSFDASMSDLQLIVAAPDLLAACQAYINCITFEETENADKLIKSSVAKALGKSQ